jgi:uncharacterized protein
LRALVLDFGWRRGLGETRRSSFLVLWAGIEELVWRRLALGGLAQQSGWPIALVASSLAFAATHRFEKPSQFVTGLAFGSVYLLTGTVLAPVVMHGLYNVLVDRALRCSIPSRVP